MNGSKVYKVFNWISLGFSYAFIILAFIGIIISKVANSIDEINVAANLVTTGFIIYFVALLFHMVTSLIGLITSAFVDSSVSSHIMGVKLAYIPFYVFSFINLILVWNNLSGFEPNTNPYIFTLVIFIGSIPFVFFTSLPNLSYFISKYIKKKIKVNAAGIVWLVLSFLAGVDAIAATFLYLNENKYSPENVEERQKKTLEDVKTWSNEKGMSFKKFKVMFIVSTIIMYASIACMLTYALVISIVDHFAIETVATLIHNPVTLICIGVILLTSIFKIIVGNIYGRRGKENPINFVNKMKFINLGVCVVLIVIAAIAFMMSSMFMFLALLFGIFFVVIIMAMAAITSYIVGALTLGIGCYSIATFLLVTYGDNMVVVSYLLNQRKMNNRKFRKKSTVIYIVMLFFPIFDLVAMALLKDQMSDINVLLGNKPVIIEK